ncbi:hypothetical protein PG994_009251 [Apiospora phragmitis]|uniref:Uncharacterized protein n=1 Tax=Apiospora phragmitis TaxID=2905665 RepID=A0ABR1ULM1_9PEZI
MPLTAEQYDRVYERLGEQQRGAVDNALELYREGRVTKAVSFFLENSGLGLQENELAPVILSSYARDEGAFRRAMLEFFTVEIQAVEQS